MCRRDFKLVENPPMDDPIRNDSLKSSGSVKQEKAGLQVNLHYNIK